MLKALVNGTESPETLAAYAKGRLRSKQSALTEALTGRVREHHRFLLQTHLELQLFHNNTAHPDTTQTIPPSDRHLKEDVPYCYGIPSEQLEFLEQHLKQFDERIEQLIQSVCPTPKSDAQLPSDSSGSNSSELPLPWRQAMSLLDTIPGVARQSAELLLAEVGVDMSRFPSAAHLCKWAGVCPGNHESAGKQYSGKTPPSNRWLRGMLVQMANAAVRCKTSYFATVYRRLAPRRGHKRAIVAVAHRLLIAVYHMLRQHQPYQDYRTTDTGQRSQEQRLKKLQQQVEQLGYQVQLVPLAVTQPLS